MKKALYTVTPGRSGTKYVTELLRQNLEDATVFHERTGFPNFGVNTPDASHATTFNHVGNVEHVKNFWVGKLRRDAADPKTWLVDVSHHLAKAGLIENLADMAEQRQVYIVLLRRDPFKVAWSYINRFEFVNNGFTWLFSLDPNYPRRIIDSIEFAKQGVFGKSIWYVNEVFARQAYYRRVLQGQTNVQVIDVNLEDLTTPPGAERFLKTLNGAASITDAVKLPAPQNATAVEHFGQKIKEDVNKLLQMLWVPPEEAAKEFYEAGQRLGATN